MPLEIFLIFARLGAVSFGGPAAHIALFEDEFVRRRAWLTAEDFLALNAAAQLIPGPNSTELAIHIGHRRGGFRGLMAAGLGFILPAFLLTLAVAWAYVRFGTLPEVRPALVGIKLAVLVVVGRALYDFARQALNTAFLAALAIAAGVAVALGANELQVLLVAGLVSWSATLRSTGIARGLLLVPFGQSVSATLPLVALFTSFAKIGAVLFGSGYVLYAFLHAEFVDRLGWLTTGQITDAIAAGQLTPGPLFSSATFVGYLIAGPPGAIAATVGIFLPAFLFVALSVPLLPRIERSAALRAFRDGVVAASLGLLAFTAAGLAADALTAPILLMVAVLIPGTIAVARRRPDPALLILGGALLGTLLG